MAKFPSRQLDLSLIEPPRQPEEAPKPQQEPEKTPKSYKEFLEEQQKVNSGVLNDSVTDIFNYKSTTSVEAPQCFSYRQISSAKPPLEPARPLEGVAHVVSQRTVSKSGPNSIDNQLQSDANVQKHSYEADNIVLPRLNNQTNSLEEILLKSKNCGCCLGPERNTEIETTMKPKPQEDLSVKDLLQIITQQSQQIMQQNNQIMLLQQQVTDLIALQKNQVDNQRANCYQFINPRVDSVETVQQRCITSTQPNHKQDAKTFNRLNQENNHFSIGMTTSYEVSVIRPSVKVPL